MKAIQYGFILALIIALLVILVIINISGILPEETRTLAVSGPGLRPVSQLPSEITPWEPDPITDYEDVEIGHILGCGDGDEWIISEIGCLIADVTYKDFTEYGEVEGREECKSEQTLACGAEIKICEAGSKLFKLKDKNEAIDFVECLANLQTLDCDWCDGGDVDSDDKLDEICINYNLKDRTILPTGDFCDGEFSAPYGSGRIVRFGNYDCVNENTPEWGECCDDAPNDACPLPFARDFCDNDGRFDVSDGGEDIMWWSASRNALDTTWASDSYWEGSVDDIDYDIAWGKDDDEYDVMPGDYYMFGVLYIEEGWESKRYRTTIIKVPAPGTETDFGWVEDIFEFYSGTDTNKYIKFNKLGFFRPEARKVRDVIVTPSLSQSIGSLITDVETVAVKCQDQVLEGIGCSDKVSCLSTSIDWNKLPAVYTPMSDGVPAGPLGVLNNFECRNILFKTNLRTASNLVDLDAELYPGNRYRVVTYNWVGLWASYSEGQSCYHYSHYDRTVVVYRELPWIEISPTIGVVGTTVTVNGGNFLKDGGNDDNEPLTDTFNIYFDGEIVGSFTPDSNGQFGPITFNVPPRGVGIYTIDIDKPEWPDTIKEFTISDYSCVGGFEIDPSGIMWKCNWGCENDAFCWRGIFCPSAKAICRRGLTGDCDGCSQADCESQNECQDWGNDYWNEPDNETCICCCGDPFIGPDTCSIEWFGGCFRSDSVPPMIGEVLCQIGLSQGISTVVTNDCGNCDDISGPPEVACGDAHNTCSGDRDNYCQKTDCYEDGWCTYGCYDEDGGEDKLTKGYCTDGSGIVQQDYCIDGTHICELVCGNSGCACMADTNCPPTSNCVDGACTPVIPTQCSDSIDNDCDFKIDYPDGDPGCTDVLDDDEHNMYGDVNGDCIIDDTDSALCGLPGHFLTNWPPCDWDNDGVVDFFDLSIVNSRDGETCAADAYECEDGIDNDVDGLTDACDPDCHTDGDVTNWATYIRLNYEAGAPPPGCGDGAVNPPEECDIGPDLIARTADDVDAACPGLCQTDCTCPPAQFCGDGAVNGVEECDIGLDLIPGTADDVDAACPGFCQADCTCAVVFPADGDAFTESSVINWGLVPGFFPGEIVLSGDSVVGSNSVSAVMKSYIWFDLATAYGLPDIDLTSWDKLHFWFKPQTDWTWMRVLFETDGDQSPDVTCGLHDPPAAWTEYTIDLSADCVGDMSSVNYIYWGGSGLAEWAYIDGLYICQNC